MQRYSWSGRSSSGLRWQATTCDGSTPPHCVGIGIKARRRDGRTQAGFLLDEPRINLYSCLRNPSISLNRLTMSLLSVYRETIRRGFCFTLSAGPIAAGSVAAFLGGEAKNHARRDLGVYLDGKAIRPANVTMVRLAVIYGRKYPACRRPANCVQWSSRVGPGIVL